MFRKGKKPSADSRWEYPPRVHQPCAASGCAQHAQHKAPLSPRQPGEFQWFCEAHISDFNREWDYFEGMSQEEIERFQKDAITGHRPTWRPEDVGRYTEAGLEEALNRLMGEEWIRRPESPAKQRQSDEIREALAVLDLAPPLSPERIKQQYKKLVKLHHPDVNGGDEEATETFKRITEAYQFLKVSYEEGM